MSRHGVSAQKRKREMAMALKRIDRERRQAEKKASKEDRTSHPDGEEVNVHV